MKEPATTRDPAASELRSLTIASARPRLAEALAVVTGRTARWWEPRVAHATLWMMFDGVCIHEDGDAASDLVRLTIVDPREAWEAMASAGLVGYADVEREDRCFAGYGRDEVGRVTHGGWSGTLVETLTTRGAELMTATERVNPGDLVAIHKGTVTPVRAVLSPHPATVSGVVVLASRWSDVLAAEELARSYLRRAAAVYGQGAVPEHADRVVWAVRDPVDLGFGHDEELRKIGLAIRDLGFELERCNQEIMMACPPLGARAADDLPPEAP